MAVITVRQTKTVRFTGGAPHHTINNTDKKVLIKFWCDRSASLPALVTPIMPMWFELMHSFRGKEQGERERKK